MAPQQLVGGLLVVLGLVLLVLLPAGVAGEAVPLLVGVGFLIAYAVTRSYGFLIPGGILTGLGVGVLVTATGGPDGAPVLGLGLGFLAIAGVDRLARRAAPGAWWPLIPGSILTLIGISTLPGTQQLMRYLIPAGFVAGGLWLILGRRPRPAPPSAAIR